MRSRPLLLLAPVLLLTGCSTSGEPVALADASEGQKTLSWVADVSQDGWSMTRSEPDWALSGELCGTIQATLIRGENREVAITADPDSSGCSPTDAEARAWIEGLLADEDVSWDFDYGLLTIWTESKLLAFEVKESF